jgi:hypothetical protein
MTGGRDIPREASGRRGSKLLFGCIGCLGLVLLLVDLVFSRNDQESFDGNTSSPPSIAGLRLR